VANHLSVTKSNAIGKLHQQGQSQRQIAEALNVDRKTVRRHLAAGQPLSEGEPDSKGTTAPTGSSTPPETQSTVSVASASGSDSEPFRQTIEAKLQQGLHAQRIFQDLQDEYDFQGSYWSVRRFVKKLKTEKPTAFRRIEVEPGWEAQVDFGTGAPVIGKDGKKRRTHVLRVVLSHSRKGYAEVVLRQTTDDFLTALENAFWHFGGVPKTVVIDNLRAAVKKADWYDPELVPKLRAFEKHYGTTILPTRAYTPRHKGKVERGVDFVQENALRGRSFSSLIEQNDFLAHWEATVADLRIHGTTRKQVGAHFDASEKHTLLPLPTERFANFTESRRKVNRDGHVAIDRAFYSAPPEYVGREVWARWDARTVRLLDDDLNTIAVFARSEQGKFNTKTQHIASEKINSVERGGAYLLKKVAFIGVNSTRWSQAMLRSRGIAGHRVLQGLLSLSNQYRCEQIEQACDIAWRHGDFHLRTIRRLIERGGPVQELMPFLEDHELIRPLAAYDQFVHECVQDQLTS
jgi:transposase